MSAYRSTACGWLRFLIPISVWLTHASPSLTADEPSIGLPITRSYSIEEIGVTRGPQLDFDRYGRLAVIGGGSYIVLNDGAWIELKEGRPGAPIFLEVTNAPDGRAYFGALATWGIADYASNGEIQAVSMRPDHYPEWINVTNFTHINLIENGILFSGSNGIVHLNPGTGALRFHEIPQIATVFTFEDSIFVSSNSLGTARFDLETGETTLIDPEITIHQVATLANGRLVTATTGGSLLFFDGREFTDIGIRLNGQSTGGISRLEALPDGGFAAAVDGSGVYLFHGDGKSRMALTTTSYRRVYDLAAREAGVLWIAKESSLEKVLYNDPVSVIDQRSDVVIGWPQVFQWSEQTVVASNGRLYDMNLAQDGRHYVFNEIPNPPPTGAWAVASNQKHLVVGNGEGVFFRTSDGFVRIPGMPEASRLFLPEDDLCIVVGISEIAAMRWADGKWAECAPRVPGVGFPSIAHPAANSLWIELGLNRAARVWFENGQLHKQLFLDFPWADPTWVNIGILNNYAVLSGPENQRVYLDCTTGEPIPPPPLESALQQVSQSILRVAQDESGRIWATLANGIVTLHPGEESYQLDTHSLSAISDLYPVITLLNQQHAWISTESALYHVDQDFQIPVPSIVQPFLVSIKDGKTGLEIYSAAEVLDEIAPLPWEKNHLVFRYFSGGYITMRDPVYEFTMENGGNSWSVQSADSLLTLPQLEEGVYHLSVQLKDGNTPIGKPILTHFTVRPPWYRAPLAYVAYWSSGLLLCVAVALWGVGQAKRKHDYLEQLVRERTDELRATGAKLTEEARTSATLAERNRLAGEIHDSLQQGLSGLALHLESTLKINHLEPDIHARLSVARRMVSFTRQEVQQAVWDLESPLLQNDSLDHALVKLAELIGNETPRIEVETMGTDIHVSSTINHHLLRMAQEAITNAVRHSGAAVVQVQLQVTTVQVLLTISDNGQGFVIADVLTGGVGHFGLRGLRSRAQKINGDLQVTSSPGEGTTVRIAVPLPDSSASTTNPA
ncbi:sensor histidine kinase [Synoicihabitans lomoniglobus]|uniref:Sensor histidine kinase n=1 Tax=Synoicihabitans lomoniglobus TaxID=2909285 RepID=A0AAF0CLP7_9BACT|nr:sensor histidine kinase [Opitutaceae bacterium LMO-M01]WED63108.1 sensor histidine kinase [Opitutaceae bacterium LMO-M01]